MSWKTRYEDDSGRLAAPRLLVALWIVRLGKQITRLGDWLGGWDGNAFGLGFRMGVRMERERRK